MQNFVVRHDTCNEPIILHIQSSKQASCSWIKLRRDGLTGIVKQPLTFYGIAMNAPSLGKWFVSPIPV